ncbi:MAG TPA: hypothetical protein VFF52_20855, partial [Isosphaeraceae bacterium]|nr:hypothetical protein [Isosphaeraceae bacterium]
MNPVFLTIARGGLRAAVGLAASIAALVLPAPQARGQAAPESLERPDGRRVEGHMEGDARSGFRFVPRDGGAPLALEPGCVVHQGGPGPDLLASPPPFHVLVGEAARLSGWLRGLTGATVRLGVGWQSGEVTLPRPCVQAIVQQPGEARVLVEDFEALDPARWSIRGPAELVDQPHLSQRRSLRLRAEGAELTYTLEEPLGKGRLDLAFFDDGSVVAGRQSVLEPAFRGVAGRSVIRVILGWSEETLAVESPSGPALAVQRLARRRGWHRLSLRFGPDLTEIAVDGQELAHGKGPDGPLIAIHLATRTTAAGAAPKALAAHFDDLQLIRFAEPPASLEIDISQDEARLVVGDQLYGEIPHADAERVVMAVDGRPVVLRWGEVAGLYFRRTPLQGTPIAGLLVRAEWRAAPGGQPGTLDFAEGALTAQSATAVTLETPYSGTLTIPRSHLRRVVVLGQGRRLVLDVSAHHLGDEISVTPPLLDPPQPEGLTGLTLERTFTLEKLPDQPAELVLDVLEVVGESG